MSGPWEEFSQPSASSDTGPWSEFSSQSAPAVKPQGILGGLGSSLKRGIDSTVDYGKISLTDNPNEIAGIVSDNLRNQPQPSVARQKMNAEIEPYATEAKNAQGIVDNVGAYAKLYGKRAVQLAENPREFAGMVAENLPNSAPGLAGMVAGGIAGAATPVPFGAAIGGVVGGTAGGYKIEQGSSMFDQVVKEAQARGIDTNNKPAMSAMIAEKYPEFLKASQLKGVGTAGTDAVLNVATLGVAGIGERALAREARSVADLAKAGKMTGEEAASAIAGIEAKNAARNTIGQKALRGAGVAAGEMAGESLSEAAGQQLAYGKLDPLDVVDEGLLAFGQGVGMAAGRKFISPLVGATDKDGVTQEIDRARAFAATLNQSVGGDVNAVPALITDLGPLQQRIDDLHGIGNTPMSDAERSKYEQEFNAAFGEVVGYTTDKDGMEIPFTMGDYLNSQVRSADITRDRPKAANAVEQSDARLQQVADEETSGYVAPEIPVVGTLSAVANMAVKSGANAQNQMQQAMQAALAKQGKPEKANGPIAAATNAQVATQGTQGAGGNVPGSAGISSPSLAGNAARTGNGAEVAAPGLRPAVSAGIAGVPAGQLTPEVSRATQSAQMAAQAPQANDAQAAPAGQFDVSNRTDGQLAYLSQNGKPGWKESAIAEMQRRGNQAVNALNAPNSSSTVALNEQQPAPVPQRPNALRESAERRKGNAARDDLVGAIMRVTGGRGIAANMAQTVVGDKANNATKVRGLFTNVGIADLDDTATLLRDEEGYDVRDGNHLAELIRSQADGNPVYSTARIEREAAAEAEKRHRDEIRSNAKKFGIKTVARPFGEIEKEVLRRIDERHTEAVNKLDARARARFDAMLKHAVEVADFDEVDAIITDAQNRFIGRDFFTQATRQLRGYIDDLTLERQAQEQSNASEETQGTSEEPDWLRSGTENPGGRSAPAGAPESARRQAGQQEAGLTLEGQTNEQAAEQFAQQQAGDSAEITKEQADRERDAVPFAMQQQSQPKPQGVQTGLFTADGRATKAADQEPVKNETPSAATGSAESVAKNQEPIKNHVEQSLDMVDAVSQPKTDASQEAKPEQAPAIPDNQKAANLKVGDTVEFTDHVGGVFHPGDSAKVIASSKGAVQFETKSGGTAWLDHARLDRGQPTAWIVAGSQSANSEPDADTRFAKNTIFTADKVAAAKARMKAKLGTMNSGIDPELLIDGMTIAGAYIESGVRKFADYTKAMVADLGDGVKPYLLSFYEAARAYPGLNKLGMDSAESAASQHQALLTPAVIAQAKEVVGESPKVEKKKPANLGEALKLKADWGVPNIDGYTRSKTGANQETDYGLKGGIKDEFMADATRYLKAAAKLLEAQGFTAHLDNKGKPMKSVSANEAGPAVSGEVSLIMRNGDFGIYAQVGTSAVRGIGPSHPQGVSLMVRTTTDATKHRYGEMNNWLPLDLSSGDLAGWFEKRMAIANASPAPTMEAKDTNGVKNANALQPEELPGTVAGGTQNDVGHGHRDRQSVDAGLAADGQGSDSVGRVPGRPEGTGGAGNQGQAGQQHEPSVELGKERGDGAQRSTADADAAGELDHVIDAEDIGKGGLTKKYSDNIAAIKIIKVMEAEGRAATPEERKQIARYAGWGAIKGVFDPANKQWAKQHEELKALLTEAEFAAARKSTLNAHYTSPVAVGAMYDALERLGFTGGRVLEPSVGVGNFFGLMPAKLRNASNLHGVELDSLTSRLVAALYPKAKIAQATGFQDFEIPAEFFDAVIGNPPFGSEPIVDMNRSPYSGFSIHNYFLAKSIDKLRPGGIMEVVVSHNFLDAQDERARQWIAERASLIGGVRLPNTAFKENAGTEVVTDILIFQKKSEAERANGLNNDHAPWLKVVDQQNTNPKTGETATHKVSQFFADNQDLVLGQPSAAGTMYAANEYTVEATGDIKQKLDAWVKTLPGNIFTPIDRSSDRKVVDMEIPDGIKTGSFYVDKSGAVMRRGDDVMGNKTAEPFVAKSMAATARMKGMIGLRDLLRQQMRLERSTEASEAEIEANRAKLNTAYDDFLKKFGHVNSVTNRNVFMDDTESQLLQALEFDFDKGISAATAEREEIEPKPASAKKADIFARRVMFPPSDFMKVTSAKDALLASLNYRGKVDLAYMGEVYAKAPDEIVKELGDVLFDDPQSGIVMADEYLSGDVKTKLAEAKSAAMADSKYQRNVEALTKVIPEDKKPSEISVSIGASFIPAETYEKFIQHITGGGARLAYLKSTGQWLVEYVGNPDMTLNAGTFGTSHLSARDLFNLSMMGRGAVVKQTLRNPDGSTTTIVLEKETEAAREKQNAIKNEWQKWIWNDAERADKIAEIYNDKMNRIVERKYDGEHMTFPGMNQAITLLEHQKNGVWRGLQSFQVLYDHVVGAGKTFEMATLAMEMRRLGIARKPLFIVPNHLTLQWRSEFTRLYPGSNILAATPEDFSKDNRGRMFTKIVTGDWDAVILGHSSLKKIGLPAETEKAVLEEQIKEIYDAIEDMKRGRGDRNIIRDMEGIKARLEAKMKDKLAAIGKRDKVLTFDELGVDALFIDEMHEFKNLSYNSTMDRNPGMGNPAGSAKAFDLFVKTRWLFDTFGDKTPYITATGTPVSNSLVEMFNMQRYMQYPTLKREGLHVFDAWAKQFGSVENVYEVAPSGSGFRQSTRFAKFTNLPALMSLYNSFADTITLDDLKAQEEAQGKRFPVPKIAGGKPTLVVAQRSPLVAERMGVPRAVLNEAGEVTFGADLDQSIEIEKTKDGKWSAKVGNAHFGNFETEEEAKLRVVEKALAPNVSVAPESILGRFANLKQLTKETKGKVNALSLTGEANKAGLDYRLIDPSAPDFPGSKINLAVDNLLRIYHQWSKDKGAQLVFCDMSIPLSARSNFSSKERRLYVRGEDGMLAMKRGTLHAADGFESLPFFIVAKGDKAGKRFEVYDAATGFLVGGNFATRPEAKERSIALIEAEPNRQRWIDKREGFAEITQDLIDEYNNENSVETDGVDAFGPEDIAGMSGSAKFSVYDDIKAKLIVKGIPEREIAFIHDYATPVAKAKLFKAVNEGDVRFLIGSTPKMGAGTNVQERLVGLHHIDAPWRPSDLEQREGRIIRRGNKLYERDPDGFEVFIGRYATEQTYDTRRWQILEHKARGIEQLRNFDGTTNEIEDIDGEAANAADMKAAASGDPLILEETKLRNEVKRLERLQDGHADEKVAMERKANGQRKYAEEQGPAELKMIRGLMAEAAMHPADKKSFAPVTISGNKFTDAETATKEIGSTFNAVRSGFPVATVTFRGQRFTFSKPYGETVKVETDLGTLGLWSPTEAFSASGFIQRMINHVDRLPGHESHILANIAKAKEDAVKLREQAKQPFPQEKDLEVARAEHSQVRRALMAKGPAVPADQKAMVDAAIEQQKAKLKTLGFGQAVEEMFASQGAGNITGKTDSLSPADTAIYGMATEGKSAAEILKFIASASRNPMNRQLAKLLLKTGIAPSITVGDGKGWKMNAGEGHKYAAAYNPKTDTVALFRPASAERHVLHELIHAATLRALGKKSLASAQMKALFAHVQKNGRSAGLFYDAKTGAGIYGMANVDEFVAEVFSNPKFQQMLKQVSAPQRNDKPSSAWDWFVRVVRGILGVPQGQENALSRAIELGIGVMREDMKIRRSEAGVQFSEIAGDEIEKALGRTIQEKARNWMKARLQGKSFQNDATGWDISVGRKGIGKVMMHAAKDVHSRSVVAIPDLIKNAVLVASEANRNTKERDDVPMVHHFYAPLRVGGSEYVARLVVKETRSGQRFYDFDTSDEISPAVLGETHTLSQTRGAAPSARLNMSMAELLSYVKAEHGGTDPKFIRYATGPKQTDSAAFRKWFGDSKVVDANGEPLVVYHGTMDDIEAFDEGKGYKADPGWLGRGFYFTTNPDTARYYATNAKTGKADPNILPVYLSLQNPYYATVRDKEEGALRSFGNKSKFAIAKRKELIVKGHDGVILDFKKGGGFADELEIVVFSPSQIKSAIGNNGDFDGSNPDIRYNVADEGWSVSEPSKMDDLIYALQDKQIDMKRVVQSIMRTGKKVKDEVNAYLQEELFHGRAAKGVKDFLDFELRPLLKEMQEANVDMGDFEEYLWNRHAEERNKQIAKINQDMPDGGSGIDTADARAFLASIPLERKKLLEQLASRVEAINKASQKVLVESGLEKQSTIDAWNGAYQHYVPLQREDVDSGHVGTGKGFSVRGSSSKRAMGSGKKVVDIIANLTMQRERNIVRAEKNRVSNALLGLAVQNPNPDFWKVDQAPKERVVQEKAIYTVLDSDGNKIEEFTRMDEAERLANKTTGASIDQTRGDRVTERVTPGFTSRDNVLLTRINGDDHYVIFNESNERAMRMATAMKNLDMDNLGRVLSMVGKATRYLSAINTQYNPIFGVINLVRDTQGALINLSSTPLAGEQKRVLGYTKDALVGIYKDIRAHRSGAKPSSNWAALFEEFQKEGGQTGYRDQYANADARAESIKSELEQFKDGKAKQLARGLLGWLSDYNETMENAVRLAAYKAAKEKGMSNQQAASLAKNITVNFNRKGQMATQVGALYAFFNASVQGSARIAETLFEQHGGDIKNVRLSKKGKQILAGGIMLGAMQALLLAAAGFDDDEPPEFIRERNLILPIGGGKYLTLAMPLGLHVIPGIGRIATEFVLSGGKDPLKRIAAFGSMFADAFNPIGSAGWSLQTITPSVVDPFAALAENKDFTGKEIYREDFNKLNPTPGHARAKDVATIWSRYISEALNFMTGGTEFKPGMFSPSPDSIDYLIGQVTGGIGREANKVAQTVGSGISGEDLPLYKIPLVGRFVGDTEGQSGVSAKFYDAIKQINMHEAQYKGLIKDGRSAEAREYLAENQAVKLIMAGNHAELAVRKLRTMKRDLIEADADQDRVRAIDDRITETMRRFSERAGPVI